jgi:hypothetical protein
VLNSSKPQLLFLNLLPQQHEYPAKCHSSDTDFPNISVCGSNMRVSDYSWILPVSRFRISDPLLFVSN